MTRLTNIEKDTIRSKVKADLPAIPDPRPAIQKILEAHVPASEGGKQHDFQSWANLNEEIGALVKAYAAANEQRTKVDRELRQALNAVNTDKAFLEQFPALASYLPARDKPAETLPVATNLLETLREAGFEQPKAA